MKKRVVVIVLSVVGAVTLVAVASAFLLKPRGSEGQTSSSGGNPITNVINVLSGLPGGVTVSNNVADFTALGEQDTLDGVDQHLRDKTDILAIKINPQGWSAETLARLHEIRPDMALVGTYQVGAVSVALDAADMDASAASPEDIGVLSAIAPAMVNLKRVDFGAEEGHGKLPAVSAFKQANPNVETAYTFSSFGRSFDVNTTALDFRGVPMDDQGAEVRELLNLMPAVNYLDMDSCGVDDENMAAIRDDFPNVNVVWRIWFAGYTVRTDTERIFASNPGVGGRLLNENTGSLKYCTKVKYLDIGHSGSIPDISFVSYMPDLEVFIAILDDLSDISPLANCTHLEFTELFSNTISDLTPLSNLHELRHLNLGYEPYLSDLTPIMDLELERLWLTPPNSIPYSQIEEYQARHPNCSVYTGPGDPHTNWRVGERYELLREQIGYENLEYSVAENDPLYPWPESEDAQSEEELY